MSGDLNKLKERVEGLGKTVYQIERTVNKQTNALIKIDDTLNKFVGALQEITQVSKSQIAHEKDIEHINKHCEQTSERVGKDVGKLFTLVGEITPDRINSLEERMDRVDQRVMKNTESDNAQDAQFSALWQKITFGICGFGGAVFLAVMGGIMGLFKLGGK